MVRVKLPQKREFTPPFLGQPSIKGFRLQRMEKPWGCALISRPATSASKEHRVSSAQRTPAGILAKARVAPRKPGEMKEQSTYQPKKWVSCNPEFSRLLPAPLLKVELLVV